MKLITLTSLLFASVAFSAPLTSKRQARNEARQLLRAERRAAANHQTHPPINVTTITTASLNGTTKKEQYDENWAGAVLIGSGYKSVTGTFTVPTPSTPSSGSSGEEYCAAAWVGIDGDTCDTSILQTGVDFCVEDGQVYFDAWYEWYPDYSYDFTGITISAGNVVKVTVDASSTSAGVATIENLSTGVTVTHSFSNEQDALCEYNAEWIVEDFEEGDSLVPFANFGTVTFTDAYASDGGSTVSPGGATILDIEQDGQVLTSTTVSGDEVIIKYV